MRMARERRVIGMVDGIGEGSVMSTAICQAIVGKQIVVELHVVVVEVSEGGFGPRN
jgi:hypothetical protein